MKIKWKKSQLDNADTWYLMLGDRIVAWVERYPMGEWLCKLNGTDYWLSSRKHIERLIAEQWG